MQCDATQQQVTGTDCKGDCETYSKYDSTLSSTYKEDGRIFTQSYEDGSEATGVLSVDTLSIGGLTTTATFGEMATRSLGGCSTSKWAPPASWRLAEGVVGVGAEGYPVGVSPAAAHKTSA